MEYNQKVFSPDIHRKAFTPHLSEAIYHSLRLGIWRANGAGFTFIELLMAISIFSAIAVSIYSAFSTGIFAWRRLNNALSEYQQTRITLELVSNEIASFIPSEKLNLQGSKDKISFQFHLTKVSFFLDPSTNILMRSQEDLNSTAVAEEKENIFTEELLPDIKNLEFQYFCKKPDEENEYEWVDSLDPEGKSVCKAVRISITGRSGKCFTKIIPLYVEYVEQI